MFIISGFSSERIGFAVGVFFVDVEKMANIIASIVIPIRATLIMFLFMLSIVH